MDRQTFIDKLFCFGDGLTLDQIQTIERDILPDTLPDGLLDDIADTINESVDNPRVMETALYEARDVFVNSFHDCEDMIELKDYISTLGFGNITDKQTYALWQSIR